MRTEPTYVFTEIQLRRLLEETIDMFVEYRDVHGKQEHHAKPAAVNEELQGLDAERYLVAHGELQQPTMQVLTRVENLNQTFNL